MKCFPRFVATVTASATSPLKGPGCAPRKRCCSPAFFPPYLPPSLPPRTSRPARAGLRFPRTPPRVPVKNDRLAKGRKRKRIEKKYIHVYIYIYTYAGARIYARIDARGCNNKYGRVTGVNARKKYDSSWRRGHRRNGEGGYDEFPCFRKKGKKKWDEAESVAERRPHPRRGYRGIFL